MNGSFHSLVDNDTRDPIADWDDAVELEQITCPIDPLHRRGGCRLTPLKLVLSREPVDDFVWTWASELLITDDVAAEFKSRQLTGYNLLPAHARFSGKKSSRTPPRLWEVQVTGWAGLANPDSGVQLLEQTPCCGHLRYSACTSPARLIDESKWDGTDVFMVWPLPLFRFVSDRAASVILENEFTGVRLVRPDELTFTAGGFSPGRLSYWMPQERAQALGAPLGIY